MAIIEANEAAIRTAAGLLSAGRLVAFPTETVYGLGADASNGLAVAGIFAAKGRPHFNPLIVHVAGIEAASRLADFSPVAIKLAEAFWPGPLTLVMKRRAGSSLSGLVTAGLETVAVRVPNHAIVRALLTATEFPLAAPSANRSGHLSPTLARHVAADLGNAVAMVLDGGPTAHGLESTVIDAVGDIAVMLRPGAVPADAIEKVLGARLKRAQSDDVRPSSPGQLASHYAPRARLRLEALHAHDGEALLAFGSAFPAGSCPTINLSVSGDLVEAAANLFAALRQLDASGAETIAVMPIPHHGLGEAINDRLLRAAAPRG